MEARPTVCVFFLNCFLLPYILCLICYAANILWVNVRRVLPITDVPYVVVAFCAVTVSCAVARGVGRIVIGHTFPLGLMQGEVVKAAERQKRQGWKWVAGERERESDREGK